MNRFACRAGSTGRSTVGTSAGSARPCNASMAVVLAVAIIASLYADKRDHASGEVSGG